MSVKNTIRVMREIYDRNLTNVCSAEIMAILDDIEADYDKEKR